MVLLVLLLFCSCLGCLREGVWTKYTPADVARWKAQSADETAALHLFLSTQRPVTVPIPRGLSGRAGRAALRRETSAASANEFNARVAQGGQG